MSFKSWKYFEDMPHLAPPQNLRPAPLPSRRPVSHTASGQATLESPPAAGQGAVQCLHPGPATWERSVAPPSCRTSPRCQAGTALGFPGPSPAPCGLGWRATAGRGLDPSCRPVPAACVWAPDLPVLWQQEHVVAQAFSSQTACLPLEVSPLVRGESRCLAGEKGAQRTQGG